MKKCAYCGCYNQDLRVICIDCGQSLTGAEKVSDTDLDKELDAKLEKASRYSDPFSFKPRYKVVFYTSLPLLVASILLGNLSLILPDMAGYAILCFIMCILSSRFSEIGWNIQKFFLQFKVSGDIEPSDWWFISREIEIFGFFIIGVICFLYGLANNSPMAGTTTIYSTYIITN